MLAPSFGISAAGSLLSKVKVMSAFLASMSSRLPAISNSVAVAKNKFPLREIHLVRRRGNHHGVGLIGRCGRERDRNLRPVGLGRGQDGRPTVISLVELHVLCPGVLLDLGLSLSRSDRRRASSEPDAILVVGGSLSHIGKSQRVDDSEILRSAVNRGSQMGNGAGVI